MLNQVRFQSTQAQLGDGVAAQRSQGRGRSQQRSARAGEDVAGDGVVSEQSVWAGGFHGGGEAEAEQPMLNAGGTTSKNLASNRDWQSKECKAGVVGVRGERWILPGPRAAVTEGEVVWFLTEYQELCFALSLPLSLLP